MIDRPARRKGGFTLMIFGAIGISAEPFGLRRWLRPAARRGRFSSPLGGWTLIPFLCAMACTGQAPALSEGR